MTLTSPSRPNAAALLAMLALHAALFSALLAQHYRVPPLHTGKTLAPVQWLLPLAALPVDKTAQQPRPAAVRRAGPVARAAQAATQEAIPVTAPAETLAGVPANADPFDLSTTPPSPAGDALLRRQDWGAGKADHDLRGGKLARLVRPTDTLQAGLERAFHDAGEAVPPKWFSAPEIREISVPEGRTRVYKIRTAMGTYCFYKPDPSQQANYDYKLTNCPREK